MKRPAVTSSYKYDTELGRRGLSALARANAAWRVRPVIIAK